MTELNSGRGTSCVIQSCTVSRARDDCTPEYASDHPADGNTVVCSSTPVEEMISCDSERRYCTTYTVSSRGSHERIIPCGSDCAATGQEQHQHDDSQTCQRDCYRTDSLWQHALDFRQSAHQIGIHGALESGSLAHGIIHRALVAQLADLIDHGQKSRSA